MRRGLALTAAMALVMAGTALAEGLTTPPSGDNQKASVTQYVGLVKVTIDYSSPKVHNPYTKEDRHGKIYGALVPYGLKKNDEGYGNCQECPWRVGANENTVFTVSDDVKVEGKPLAAGSYGLFMIPGESEWTVIFSKDHDNWGHFWYDPANDALRVTVKPARSEYHEWLAFDFPVRDTDNATVAMRWEDLQVPFRVSVDDVNELYIARMRSELRRSAGFQWQNYATAARFAVAHKIAPKDALEWATTAATPGFMGQENFVTLSTLAQAQEANGLAAESQKSWQKAINHPTATAIDLHQYARGLLTAGKKQEALAVWQLNAKTHPNEWPVNVGLARGLSANGRFKEALKFAKLALAQAPDEPNRKTLAAGIAKLEAGKDMN
jgi:hypothetical protein